MTIGDKKIGFLYSIGADCEVDDEMQKVGVNDFISLMEHLGTSQTYIKLGAILNKWYCKANGGEPVSEDELFNLPAGALAVLEEEVSKAITEGQKTTIKAKPVPSKNAKSAAK